MNGEANDTAAVQAVLAEYVSANAEWKAYHTRVTRVLMKRQEGRRALNKEEETILADFKVAAKLETIPKTKTGEDAPPIFYSYADAADAFEWDTKTLMNARACGCPAFTGKMIFTASLLDWFAKHPSGPWRKQNLGGPRIKCTPRVIKQICEALRKCPILTTAALAAGVTRATLYNWKERGLEGEEPFATFLHETETTIEQVKLGLVQDIITDPDWHAKMAMLERIDRLTFAKRVEHTAADGKPIANGSNGLALHINLSGVENNPYAPTEETEP